MCNIFIALYHYRPIQRSSLWICVVVGIVVPAVAVLAVFLLQLANTKGDPLSAKRFCTTAYLFTVWSHLTEDWWQTAVDWLLWSYWISALLVISVCSGFLCLHCHLCENHPTKEKTPPELPHFGHPRACWTRCSNNCFWNSVEEDSLVCRQFLVMLGSAILGLLFILPEVVGDGQRRSWLT